MIILMARLDEAAVRRWLEDQRAAHSSIERERIRRLVALTPQEALRIYLSLSEGWLSYPDRMEPSPLLMAMRRVLAQRSL